MKKLNQYLLLLLAATLVIIAACNKHDDLCGARIGKSFKEKSNPASVPQGDPLNKEDVDAIIIGMLEDPQRFPMAVARPQNPLEYTSIW